MLCQVNDLVRGKEAATDMPADSKTCPRCAETVKAAALVCKHCGHEFPAPEKPPSPAAPTPTKDQPKLTANQKIGCLALFVALGAVSLCTRAGVDQEGNTTRAPDSAAEATSTPSEVSEESEIAAPPARVQSAPEPDIRMTSSELTLAYQLNEVAAQRDYGGKLLEITGIVSAVTLDIFDTPVIELAGTNPVSGVQATFEKRESEEIANLSAGAIITIRCATVSEILSVPVLDDCYVLN